MSISGVVLPYLEVAHIAPNFVLEIDGFGTRYYSRVAPSALSPYTYAPGIESVGVQSEEIDLETGISKGRGCRVVIASTPPDVAIEALCKVGPRGSARLATLATTLPHDDAVVDVVADRDVSGWDVAPFWIGQECFLPDSISGDTFVDCTRGYYGSQIQKHAVNATQGWAPHITSDLVAWRTRRARVLMAASNTDGTIATSVYIEIASGFIDSTPQTDGVSVEIIIAPWTAALWIPLAGDGEVTGLARGWHLFRAGAASTVRNQQTWAAATGFHGRTTGISLLGGLQLECTGAGSTVVGSGSQHKEVFDNSLSPSADGRPHPRAGALIIPGTTLSGGFGTVPSGYNDGPPTYFGLASGPSSDVPNDVDIHYVGGTEDTVYDVITESITTTADDGDEALKIWPDQVLAEMNAATNITDTHDGMAGPGRWINVQIHALVTTGDDVPGPAVSAVVNSNNHAGAPFLAFVPRPSDLWMLDFHSPDSDRYFRPVGGIDAAVRRPDLFRWELAANGTPITARKGQDRQYIPIRQIPDAFYQTGEQHILVRDNVLGDVGTIDPPRWVRVDFVPESQDLFAAGGSSGRVSTYGRVEFVEAIEDPDTTDVIGYRWRLVRADRSRMLPFGDYAGQESAKILPVARWRKTRPATIVAELLYSGAGNAFNSALYDVQPIGLNLSDNEVDAGSFLFFSAPALASEWTLDADPGATIADTAKGILTATVSGIVQRLNPNDGRRRLCLAQLAIPNKFEAVATLGADEWDIDDEPTGTTDDRCRARYELQLNWDTAAGKYLTTPVYIDSDAKFAGGEVGSETIELRGLSVDPGDPAAQQALVRPIIDQRRAAFAFPRRVVEATVPWYRAARLYAGATVLLSTDAPGAIGYDAARLAAGTVARVQKIEADPSNARSHISAVVYGVNTTGWAPTLEVSSLNVARTIATVAANAFTATSHPVTNRTQTDLRYADSASTYVEYFSAGDVVTVIPFGNYAARALRQIDTIDYGTREVTFTVALPAGHAGVALTIRTADYDSATAYIKGYAYVAASPPTPATLGTDDDPAYEYN